MSDDAWKAGYDAWKLRSPEDDRPADFFESVPSAPEEPDELTTLRDELAEAERANTVLRRDIEAAMTWARAYQTTHGPFKRDPSIPDFMVPF